ncbi:MAG: sulfite exporter TauE/SafE family protein [bacterium]
MSGATIIALALAAAVGLSLGVLGAGGAVLMLPILVYVAGIDVRTAVAVSLVVVGGTSLVAFGVHFRRGDFHAKGAVLFATTGTLASYFGSSLTDAVSEPALLLIFAALMLAVGLAMLRAQPARPAAARCRTVPCLGIGTVVGVLSGFLGVGGGFLIVPALVLFAGIETRIAIGTSLAVIAVNAVGGLAGHLRHAPLDWRLALTFLAFSLAGMGVGVRVAHGVSGAALRRAFAWLVVALGLSIGGLTALGVGPP